MEIVLEEKRSLRDVFRERFGRVRDSFAAEWPSYRLAALSAEEAFFSADTVDEAEKHLRRWGKVLGLLCARRDVEDDFPKPWFYRAWFEYRIARRALLGSETEPLPEIAAEAENFLDDEKRDWIEKLVAGRLSSAPFRRNGAEDRCRAVRSLE